MSKLKILAGVIIAGMWIFKEELGFVVVLTTFFGLIGGLLCLVN